jgi:hypothetical protein
MHIDDDRITATVEPTTAVPAAEPANIAPVPTALRSDGLELAWPAGAIPHSVGWTVVACLRPGCRSDS